MFRNKAGATSKRQSQCNVAASFTSAHALEGAISFASKVSSDFQCLLRCMLGDFIRFLVGSLP